MLTNVSLTSPRFQSRTERRNFERALGVMKNMDEFKSVLAARDNEDGFDLNPQDSVVTMSRAEIAPYHGSFTGTMEWDKTPSGPGSEIAYTEYEQTQVASVFGHRKRMTFSLKKNNGLEHYAVKTSFQGCQSLFEFTHDPARKTISMTRDRRAGMGFDGTCEVFYDRKA